jgi:hypothetical protein
MSNEAAQTPRPLFMAQMNQALFTPDFMSWLPTNLHVYDAFEREALRVVANGIKHYSARTIVHVLRHHTAVAEDTGGFKLDDHRSPYLARLFDLVHPEHAGLWEFRQTKAAESLPA